jgi:predicted permease
MAAISAILFARWAGDALVRVATSTVTGTPPFSAILDLRVLAFAAGVALASVLIFGIWPSWRATRVDVVGALKAGTRGAIGGATTPARLLVILQVALSLVLVMGTALFVRSFQNLIDVGLGFESARLLTVAIEPRLAGSPDANLPDTYARILEAVTRTPGVESAALGMCGLQGPCAREDEFIVEGYQPRPGENVMFSVNSVTPGYLPTLGVHLLAGRGLGESDTTGTTRVAVVNKTLARTYFAGDWQAAIGRRIGTGTPTLEIVGIVDDIRALGNVKMPAMPSVFMPLAQRPAPPREVVVRTAVDPASASADVRQAISRAAPSLPIDAIEAVATRMDRGLSQERVLVLLTSGFSLLAVGLAGFGLFGVLSYAVVRRTPELGLRMALGAPRSRVVQGVVRDALWLVGCGVLLGLPLALLGSKLVTMLTFGVLPYDGMSLLAALAVLIGIAAACAIVPAVRASRIDPVIALRSE